MQGNYIKHGSSAPRVNVRFIKPSDGTGKSGLTSGTGGLTLGYQRPGATVTAITLAAGSLTTGWVSGGFVEVADGVYQLDLPTAAAVTGVDRLLVVATALPADTAMVACIIPMGPDDFSVASPTETSIVAAINTAPVREAFSDTLLGRAAAGGANGGRTVARAFGKLLNKWSRPGTVASSPTITHYGADDVTVSHTETLSVDANGAVLGSDPA